MSGIETASLVLAILPLLVNQLDNYVQGLETIKSFRTRRYRAQFESYLTKLGTHHAILLNTLELTLEGVVDHEKDISELIHNPCGAAWNDPKFQGKMRAKLGRNYEPFARNMSELASTLEELSRKLGLDPSTPMVCSSTLEWPKGFRVAITTLLINFRHRQSGALLLMVLALPPSNEPSRNSKPSSPSQYMPPSCRTSPAQMTC
jgi:hypothetical protein